MRNENREQEFDGVEPQRGCLPPFGFTDDAVLGTELSQVFLEGTRAIPDSPLASHDCLDERKSAGPLLSRIQSSSVCRAPRLRHSVFLVP